MANELAPKQATILYNKFKDGLEKVKPALKAILKTPDDINRFIIIANTEVKKNTNLLACRQETLFGSIVLAFRYNLEVGGQLGHCALIPYNGVCTFQIMYKGYMDLVRNSNEVKTFEAYPIHQNEVDQKRFFFNYGENKVLHDPILFEEAGVRVGWWARAVLFNGEVSNHFMPMTDILKRKAVAKTEKVWTAWPKEMERKTILKDHCKLLPISIENRRIVNLDESIVRDVKATVIDDLYDKDIDENLTPLLDLEDELLPEGDGNLYDDKEKPENKTTRIPKDG